MIVLDYETRSRANLLEVGAHNYAAHQSTDILCLAMYDEDTDEKIVFDPCQEAMSQLWVDKLNNAVFIGAVNATFDRLIHQHVGKVYDFPEVAYDKWYCVSAQFRINALPANLEDAAKAAQISDLKDPRGKQLIKLLSIPQEDGSFNESPALMQEMKDYCMKDVLATVAGLRACRRLTPTEHKDWLLCERMNERGVKVDRQLALLATSYAVVEQSQIAEQITDITKGEVTKPTQYQRIKTYILTAVENSDDINDKNLLKLMTAMKDGKKKVILDKGVREAVITAVDEGNLHLYEDIEELIRLLDAASASSVAKFAKMNLLASLIDDRVRGAFIHAGASQTHRFSSKGLQLHNMKRDCYNAEQTEAIKTKMAAQEDIPDVMQSLAKLLRPALIPEKGCKFVVGDWSSIEARALPWLSGDPKAESKLDLFRKGVDTYVEAARGIYNKPSIDKSSPERQVGKIAELSLGYGGAEGAFSSMAKVYGVVLPDYSVRKIVRQWRAKNTWAVDFWGKLETAAKKAIRSRGEKSFVAGRVTYHFIPKMLGGTLICELPDGTFIQYPFARIEQTDRGSSIVALKAAVKPKATDSAKHWGEVRLWGGLLSENIAQAFCAGLLRNCIRNLNEWADYLVAHVHDELILEVPDSLSEKAAVGLQQKMEEVPAFAVGMPLNAEPVVLRRYGNH